MSSSEVLKVYTDFFVDLQGEHEKSISFRYRLLFIARTNRLEHLELILSVKNEEGDMVYFHEGDYRPELRTDKEVFMVVNMIRKSYKSMVAHHQSIKNFIRAIDDTVREKPELMEDSEYRKYYTLITELCEQTSKWPHHRYIEYAKPI